MGKTGKRSDDSATTAVGIHGARGHMRRRVLSLAPLALTLGSGTAMGQGNWPSGTIKFICPYPPGGSSDLITRLIADGVSAGLKHPVVVENKGGAGGAIGTQLFVNSPPDGNTFLMGASSAVAISPNLRKLPYDPLTDMVSVAMVSAAYGLIAARKDLPFNNVHEMAEYAKKNPGKLTFGSAGPATATHINGEIMHSKLGLQIRHIPYKGSAASLNDLMGGHIDLIYDAIALPQAKLGAVKVLAVTSAERHPELPNVPTLREQNAPEVSATWFGLFAPRGTPRAIITRMAAEVEKVVKQPETRAQMLKMSQFPKYEGPDEMAATVRKEYAYFKELFAQLGIKGE
ncbi:MAG: Bug family tripartite tricarboxylate transporter substrate binding protein [Burkholderiaceae bacterium]